MIFWFTHLEREAALVRTLRVRDYWVWPLPLASAIAWHTSASPAQGCQAELVGATLAIPIAA